MLLRSRMATSSAVFGARTESPGANSWDELASIVLTAAVYIANLDNDLL